MIQAEILGPDDQLELLEGLLVKKHCDTFDIIHGYAPLPIYRLSVEQYHEMINADILGTEDRLELLDGVLVEKMTKSPRHSAATYLLAERLRKAVPPGWYVDSQDAIVLSSSEPEPGAAIIRGNRRDYMEHHPGPSDVALVVEVSESSLQSDRTHKKILYAAAGIPVYWIVNLVDRRADVYTGYTTSVSGSEYARMEFFGPADNIPLIIENQKFADIAVSDLLP
jgi:Uma2 family endonuclease